MVNRQFNCIPKTDIELELNNLWLAIKRRWRAGLLLFVLCIALSIIAAINQKSNYTIMGKLLFKINRTPILTGIGEELNNLDSLENNANPMITEIEVLKSVPIAEQALSKLKKSNLLAPSLSAQELVKKLKIEPIVGTDVVTISYDTNDASVGVDIVNQLMQTYLQSNIINSRKDVLAAEKIVIEQLPKAKERVTKREKALQEFKEKYQIVTFERESSSIITKKDNIENEINSIKVQLQEAQNKSRTLQEQLGMNPQQAITLRNISQSPKVSEALLNLSKLQNQIIQKQEVFEDRDPAMITLYNQAKSIEAFLKNELGKIPSSINKQFTIADVQVGNSNSIQQELTASLAEVEQTISGLEEKIVQLQIIQNQYKQRFNNIPKIENEYKDLLLQLEVAQSNYRALVKSLEDIRLAEQQSINNVRIIEDAETYQTYHQAIIVLTSGFAMGIVMAIFGMTVLEITDKSVKTSEQIKEIFNYPILGSVSTFDFETSTFNELTARSIAQYLPKFKHLSQHNLNHIVAEKPAVQLSTKAIVPLSSSKSFSMLHAKFKVISENQAANALVITSSLHKEGKSKITANLALTLANYGQKVVVVDANLHKPSQHKIWQLKHDDGLTDAILDQKKLDLLLHRVTNNLDVLSSGKINNNSYDVINSHNMELLIKKLSQKYDYVLIDSPSLVESVDALNLSKMSDGIPLVARLGILDRPTARECQNLLEMTEQNVFGTIVNDKQ